MSSSEEALRCLCEINELQKKVIVHQADAIKHLTIEVARLETMLEEVRR